MTGVTRIMRIACTAGQAEHHEMMLWYVMVQGEPRSMDHFICSQRKRGTMYGCITHWAHVGIGALVRRM